MENYASSPEVRHLLTLPGGLVDQFFLVLQTLLSHQELLAALDLHSLLADLLYQLLPSK
jgi:hypothetical protein